LSLEIEIINEQTEYTLTENIISLIGQALDKAAKEHGVQTGEVVISLVDDPTIQQLNKEYRNIDRPTDVLSFAMSEEGDGEMQITGTEGMPSMLGDIVISTSKALSQAEEYGHSVEREICFLAVHGFLHLLGYDHGTKEEEKEMFSLQEEYLTHIGLIRD
jgi:probable rRNA maturation factor